MMIIEEETLTSLRNLGLTNQEARALWVVARLGNATAAGVSREVGVHYPVVYRLLASLEAKGWIESSQDRPKMYRVRDVEEVVGETVKKRIQSLRAAGEKAAAGLRVLEGGAGGGMAGGTWIIRHWDHALTKARALAKEAVKSVYIIGKDVVGEGELKELLNALSSTRGYINAYLPLDSDPQRLRREYPEANFQVTRSSIKPDPTRYISLIIIFDELQALLINAYYRDGRLEKGKVYTTWERDYELIEILMEGSNLKLKEWSWA